MKEFKSQKIKEALKSLLKKKGMTYEELATELDCSVPTVKRILGPEELSLNRLLELCDILDVNLSDLEEMTKNQKEPEEKFTEEQEKFLAENKNFLAYLMQIFSGDTPKQIAERHGLTTRSTDKYLIGLEKKGLIRVTGTLKVKSAFKSVPDFGVGVLAKANFVSLIQGSAKFFIEIISDGFRRKTAGDTDFNNSKFSVISLKMTKESYRAFVAQRNQALKDIERLASFEEKTKDPSELMMAVISEANVLLPVDSPHLKIIESMMGEITNI